MLSSIEGIYRNGKIELIGPVPDVPPGRVIVTFLGDSGQIDLATRGIDQPQAADLRQRLGAFVEDWERPDMDVYDAL